MPIKWKATRKDSSSLFISLSVSLIATHAKEAFLLSTIQNITPLVIIEQLEHEQELILVKKRLEKEYATRL